MSPFIYSQDVRDTAYQVDTIFLPAEAVTFTGSNLYFVGDNSIQMVNADGENATKFIMWNDGEKGEYWIDGLASEAGKSTQDVLGSIASPNATRQAAGEDQFYVLTDTGRKANDGQPIYTVSAPVGSNIEQGTYQAQAKNAQSAIINSKLFNVTDAKVVNVNGTRNALDAGLKWPGITDLTTLNEAGGLTATRRVNVSAVVDPINHTAITIYVDWDQPNG